MRARVDIFSAGFLAGLYAVITLLVFLFPAGWYEAVMPEPYYAGHNALMLLYVWAALLLFYLGANLIPPLQLTVKHQSVGASRYFVVGILLITLLCFLRFSLGVMSSPVIKANVAGYFVMTDIKSLVNEQALGYLLQGMVVFSVCMWSLRRHLPRWMRVLRGMTIVLVMCLLISAFQRNLLIPLVLSLLVAGSRGTLYLSYTRMLMGMCLAAAISVLLYFLVYCLQASSIRGQEAFLGYTLASFNRLAEILAGHLTMPNANTGFYSLQWFYFPPGLRHTLPVSTIFTELFSLNLPLDTRANWEAQFIAVSHANLDDKYIWATFFGYIYSDFGWLSLLFYLFYGMLFTSLKQWSRSGDMFPIFAFAYLYATSVLWFGDVFMCYPGTLLMLVLAALVDGYARLLRHCFRAPAADEAML